MADRMRDYDDERLEQLFAGEPIADDGFSDRVVRRIRRRLWLRRLLLPAAAAVGASIAFEPIVSLTIALGSLLETLPVTVDTSAVAGWMPSLPMIISGGVLFAVVLAGARLLED